MKHRTILAMSATLLLFLGVGAARAAQGRIRLVVMDEQKNPLEGVAVTMIHDEFRTKFELSTDKNGKISRIGLPIGAYDVEVSKAGFMTVKGKMFIGIGDNRVEGGFPQESVPGELQWKNNRYRDFIMLKGAASPAGVELGGVEMSEASGKIYKQGLDAYKAGDYATARTEFEKILKENPDLPHTYFFLFDIYNKLGEKDLAYEVLKRGVAIDPAKTDAQMELAKLAGERGDTDTARKAYQAVLSKDPTAAFAERDLGLLELKAAHWEEAKKHLSRYVEMAPTANDTEWIKKCLVDIDKYME